MLRGTVGDIRLPVSDSWLRCQSGPLLSTKEGDWEVVKYVCATFLTVSRRKPGIGLLI